MLLHRPVAILCATLALSAGMAHAEQPLLLPHVAPGLWQIDVKTPDAEPNTRWFCIQAGHTELLPLSGNEAEQCTHEYRAQADDSVTLTMRCEPSADERMDISGVFRGDFARAYTGEVQAQYVSDASTQSGQVQARRIGNCTPGVAPCDHDNAGECYDPND